jgi:alkylation response protein AidB-like acyl-CoA dehydrogenase
MLELSTSFEIPPEVEELRDRVRRLVREELLPFEREIEETDSIPDAVRDIVRGSGLHGLQVPAEYGGMELGMFAACVVTRVRRRARDRRLGRRRHAREVPAPDR